MQRLGIVIVTFSMLTGCSLRSELDEARRQAAACRMELDTLKQEPADLQGSSILKAQRDRYAAQCEELRGEVAQLKLKLQEQRRSGGDDPQLRQQLDDQRRQLETALSGIQRSREEWEQSLADRQRKIDILTNQVERLQKELKATRDLTSKPVGE